MFVLVIGAGLGFERRLLVHDRKPELGDHLVEHVIGEIAQPASTDLQRHVAVAEVVTDARELRDIVTARGRDRIRLPPAPR